MENQLENKKDLQTLLNLLPKNISENIYKNKDLEDLLEVVIDIGRYPEARFRTGTINIINNIITIDDINHISNQLGKFSDDNRAGIEKTLHRISAIKNRNDKIIGLTLRVGRAIYGTIKIIEDLIHSGKSILLIGKPGVGKTTMLREIARVLADEGKKRVIIVDTSNEIGGDGDIPHNGIGKSRRMQVSSPSLQHSIMIEAVENHMPEIIIVDEIGNELDAIAARTIAERGVQLIATAHGNTLENLMANPTLTDLVGGLQAVTLGDEEAKKRNSQKTILERKSPPTFDILIEIHGWTEVAIYEDVSKMVDQTLRGKKFKPEVRKIDENGNINSIISNNNFIEKEINSKTNTNYLNNDTEIKPALKILPYGINKGKLQQVITDTKEDVEITTNNDEYDILVTTKNYYRRKTKTLLAAEKIGKPIYVLRRNSYNQIQTLFNSLFKNKLKGHENIKTRIEEAEIAINKIGDGQNQINLNPQSAYIRYLQHEIAEKNGLDSFSTGKPTKGRYVTIYKE